MAEELEVKLRDPFSGSKPSEEEPKPEELSQEEQKILETACETWGICSLKSTELSVWVNWG